MNGYKLGIDPTVKIWEELYLCRVSNFKTMSVDYLKIFGTPTSNMPAVDDELSKELIQVMIPIATMIDYYKEGIPVRIVKSSDTKFIYEAISTHLTYWKDQLATGFNTRNAPVDDLIIMDRFAQEIYPFAQVHFDHTLIDSLLVQGLTKASNFNTQNILRNISSNLKPPEDKLPERSSMADFLKDKKIGIRKWQS
jgi:hypothetical protein